jgi:hypothetical protein
MRIFTIKGDNSQYGQSITGKLSEFQEIVGGSVQAINLRDDLTIWVNEEGKLNGMPYNHSATLIFQAIFGKGTDVIVGDAFFTGGVDENGNTLEISDGALSYIKKLLSSEAEKFISDHIKIITVSF